MPDEITFDDCCRIILEDWRWRQDDNEPELLDYKRNLLTLLNKEFGIGWVDKSLELPQHEGLPALVTTMPRDYGGLAGPFASWIEYDFLSGEQKVLDLHRKELAVAETALKQRWIALFRDLLLMRWPDAVRRKTSWARLRDLGLGEPVDEIDFF